MLLCWCCCCFGLGFFWYCFGFGGVFFWCLFVCLFVLFGFHFWSQLGAVERFNSILRCIHELMGPSLWCNVGCSIVQKILTLLHVMQKWLCCSRSALHRGSARKIIIASTGFKIQDSPPYLPASISLPY